MAEFRPLIAITPGYDCSDELSYSKYGYYEGIYKAGGLATIIPMTEDKSILSEVVARFDGFLIPGGVDVDASVYGEGNLPCNGEISPYRDTLELFIIRKAIESNKPVFGICRGIQVMNVAMGGTLYQDIHHQIKDRELLKHSQQAPKWYATHEILIEKGSKVWSSFGRDMVKVNTFHHQAVKDVAPGFIATSKSEDGIIESIEHETHPFAVGVQWHPELMWKQNEEFLKLFEDFVNSCKL